MKRLFILVALVAIAGAVTAWRFRSRLEPLALLPPEMAAALTADCRQVVLVLAEHVDRVPAEVWLIERDTPSTAWRTVRGPLPANLGRNGVGWGAGDPPLPKPGNFPDKREGDGRSPAGIFTLPWAFGTKPAAAVAGLRLPWRECTETLRGVDDVNSRYYNRIVDETVIPDKDWNSAEIMRRADGLYDEGVAIGHNLTGRRGAGSCIFLHIWSGQGQGTAGCTALSRENVSKIVRWLDPAKSPRLVLNVRGAPVT